MSLSPCVEDDDARLVADDEEIDVIHRVGDLGAAEAAVQRRHVGKRLLQIPEPDAGASDEHDSADRRIRPVLLLESGHFLRVLASLREHDRTEREQAADEQPHVEREKQSAQRLRHGVILRQVDRGDFVVEDAWNGERD